MSLSGGYSAVKRPRYCRERMSPAPPDRSLCREAFWYAARQAVSEMPPSPRGRGTAVRRWRDNRPSGDLPLCGSIPQSTYGCQPSYASLRIGSANQIKDLERRVPLGQGGLAAAGSFQKTYRRQPAARKKPPSPRGRGTADRRWRDNRPSGDLPLCGSIPQSTYGCQPPLGKGALRPPAVFKKPIGGNLPPVRSPLY